MDSNSIVTIFGALITVISMFYTIKKASDTKIYSEKAKTQLRNTQHIIELTEILSIWPETNSELSNVTTENEQKLRGKNLKGVALKANDYTAKLTLYKSSLRFIDDLELKIRGLNSTISDLSSAIEGKEIKRISNKILNDLAVINSDIYSAKSTLTRGID